MSQEQQQDGAGLQQQQPRPGKVQLGEFWLQAPNAWFAAAELKFEVAHITGERECFAHTVGAMGFTVLRAVLDLVENPPADEPYTTLKGRLVLAHQLTPVQKATKCLQVVASGNQRPSEVLASLLEYCPLCILQSGLHYETTADHSGSPDRHRDHRPEGAGAAS